MLPAVWLILDSFSVMVTSLADASSADFFAFVADVAASPALDAAVEAEPEAAEADSDASVAFLVTSLTCSVIFPAVWLMLDSFSVIVTSFAVASSADFFALAAEADASPALDVAVEALPAAAVSLRWSLP